jgi:hypothetical protein
LIALTLPVLGLALACSNKGLVTDTSANFDDLDVEWPESDTSTPDLTGQDLDGDGYADPNDCDDEDADVNPGAEEIEYDGIDNDCDESTADDDLDGDGYGADEDCDDLDANVNPDGDDCDDELEPRLDEAGVESGFDDLDRSPGTGAGDGSGSSDANSGGGSSGDGDGADDVDPDENFGDTGYDAEGNAINGTIKIDGGACGCSASAAAGGLAGVWMVGLVGLLRRRR